MSLVKLLSGEPLPLPPPNVDPALDKYIRDLHNYLQRLGGYFTGQNIRESMVGELLFDKFLDVWVEVTGTGTVEISSDDWRGGYLATRDGFTWSTTPNEVVWTDPTYTDDFVGSDCESDYIVRDKETQLAKVYNDPVTNATASVLLALKGETGKIEVECTAFDDGATGKTLKLRYFLWGSPTRSKKTHLI